MKMTPLLGTSSAELACSVTLHDGFYGSWKLEDLRTLPNQISAAPSSPSTVQDHLSASAQCLALRSVCAPAPAPMAASMPLRCLRRLLRAPPPSPPASSAGLQRFISSAPEVEGRSINLFIPQPNLEPEQPKFSNLSSVSRCDHVVLEAKLSLFFKKEDLIYCRRGF